MPTPRAPENVLRFVTDTSLLPDQEAERGTLAHATSLILAECTTVYEAMPRLLQVICTEFDWDVGAFWCRDDHDTVLRCLQLWHRPLAPLTGFKALSQYVTLPCGVDLPGRTWASGMPTWVTDVGVDATAPRERAAARAGLHVALGYPIVTGNGLRGVMEFFSRHSRPPDRAALQALAAMGPQIGQFLERTQAEAALRESEQQLSAVVSYAPIILFAVDGAGVCTLWEGRGLEAVNSIPGELVGRSMFEVQRERPELVDMVRGALVGRSTSALHEVAGRVFETRYVPLSDEHGRTGAGTIGVAADVTPQWRAEQEVRRSKDHLRAVMDRLSELVAIVNADGTVDYVSPSCRRVLGYVREDLIGRNAGDFVHPDDVAAMRKALAAVVGHHADAEDAQVPALRVRHADGSWCTLALRRYNHLDDPAVHGIILISHETSAYADMPRR